MQHNDTMKNQNNTTITPETSLHCGYLKALGLLNIAKNSPIAKQKIIDHFATILLIINHESSGNVKEKKISKTAESSFRGSYGYLNTEFQIDPDGIAVNKAYNVIQNDLTNLDLKPTSKAEEVHDKYLNLWSNALLDSKEEPEKNLQESYDRLRLIPSFAVPSTSQDIANEARRLLYGSQTSEVNEQKSTSQSSPSSLSNNSSSSTPLSSQDKPIEEKKVTPEDIKRFEELDFLADFYEDADLSTSEHFRKMADTITSFSGSLLQPCSIPSPTSLPLDPKLSSDVIMFQSIHWKALRILGFKLDGVSSIPKQKVIDQYSTILLKILTKEIQGVSEKAVVAAYQCIKYNFDLNDQHMLFENVKQTLSTLGLTLTQEINKKAVDDAYTKKWQEAVLRGTGNLEPNANIVAAYANLQLFPPLKSDFTHERIVRMAYDNLFGESSEQKSSSQSSLSSSSSNSSSTQSAVSANSKVAENTSPSPASTSSPSSPKSSSKLPGREFLYEMHKTDLNMLDLKRTDLQLDSSSADAEKINFQYLAILSKIDRNAKDEKITVDELDEVYKRLESDFQLDFSRVNNAEEYLKIFKLTLKSSAEELHVKFREMCKEDIGESGYPSSYYINAYNNLRKHAPYKSKLSSEQIIEGIFVELEQKPSSQLSSSSSSDLKLSNELSTDFLSTDLLNKEQEEVLEKLGLKIKSTTSISKEQITEQYINFLCRTANGEETDKNKNLQVTTVFNHLNDTFKLVDEYMLALRFESKLDHDRNSSSSTSGLPFETKDNKPSLIQEVQWSLALQNTAQKYHLILKDVKDDGNCLFHAISDQLKERYGVTLSADYLRIIAMEQMKTFPDIYADVISGGADYNFRHLTKETLKKYEKEMANAFEVIRAMYNNKPLTEDEIYAQCLETDAVSTQAANCIIEAISSLLAPQEIVETHANSMLEHLNLNGAKGSVEEPKWADHIHLKLISDALNIPLLCFKAPQDNSPVTLDYYAQNDVDTVKEKEPLLIAYNGISHYSSLREGHNQFNLTALKSDPFMAGVNITKPPEKASKALTIEQLRALAAEKDINKVADIFTKARNDEIAKENKLNSIKNRYPSVFRAAQEYNLTLKEVSDHDLFHTISDQLKERYEVDIPPNFLCIIAMEQMKTFPELYANFIKSRIDHQLYDNFISSQTDYGFRHLAEGTLKRLENHPKMDKAFKEIRALYNDEESKMTLDNIYQCCREVDEVGQLAAGFILEAIQPMLAPEDIAKAHDNLMLENLNLIDIGASNSIKPPNWSTHLYQKLISDALGIPLLSLETSDKSPSTTLHYYAQHDSLGEQRSVPVIAYNGEGHYLSLHGDDSLITKIKTGDSIEGINIKETSGNASKPLTVEQIKELAKQDISNVTNAFRNAKGYIAKENKPNKNSAEDTGSFPSRAEAKKDAIALLKEELADVRELNAAAKTFLQELNSSFSPTYNLQNMSKNFIKMWGKKKKKNHPEVKVAHQAEAQYYRTEIRDTYNLFKKTYEEILKTIETKYQQLEYIYENLELTDPHAKIQKTETQLVSLRNFVNRLLNSTTLKMTYLDLIDAALDEVMDLNALVWEKYLELERKKPSTIMQHNEVERVEGIKNKRKAFEEYKLLAKNGNSYAQLKVAECYQNGTGTPQSFMKAVESYEKITETYEFVGDYIKRLKASVEQMEDQRLKELDSNKSQNSSEPDIRFFTRKITDDKTIETLTKSQKSIKNGR